jgi:hypothetical protein
MSPSLRTEGGGGTQAVLVCITCSSGGGRIGAAFHGLEVLGGGGGELGVSIMLLFQTGLGTAGFGGGCPLY